METNTHPHFARRVLSSTRISEDSDDECAQKFNRSKSNAHLSGRRRLRVFDEDDERDDAENVDPLLLSDPLLPSSIRFPSAVEEDNVSDGSVEHEEYSGSASYCSQYSDEAASPSSPADRPVKQSRVEERHERVNEMDLPHTEAEENIGRSEEVDEDVLTRLRKATKGAAKRTVKNPRPKLDPQRLLSDKGLPALLDDFKKVHFRGKGFEFQDLDRLLFVYAAWAHRLVPKSSFPEVIERLEKAGTRREIRVTLHRLRNGIWPPSSSTEHIHNDEESDTQPQEDNVDMDDLVWERALREVPDNTVPSSEPLNTSVSYTEATTVPSEPVFGSFPSTSGSATTLVESVEDRAERNRQLALKLLNAKRKSTTSSHIGTASPNSSLLKSAFVASISSNTCASTTNGHLHMDPSP